MAAARVALALGLVAAATQTAPAEPCAPRAELGGDAEAVAKVAAELQRLGVDANTDPLERTATKCPVIVAAVELDRSGGIAVAVRDASQRSEGRVVSDAALAAAWIDSWLRDDFSAPPSETPPLVTAPPAEVPPAAPAAPDTPLLDRFSLTASFLQTWSDDSTSWSGLALSSCVLVEGFCLGARAAYATQTVSADVSAAGKRDLSLLATASYPHSLGRMSIAPELGLGVGQLTTSRVEGCKYEPPACMDPMDPTCMNQPPAPTMCPADGTSSVYVGDNFTATTYTPRVSAAFRIAIPLFDHVWLDGLAAATIAPFGHADDYATDATMTMTDPNTMPGGTTGAFPLPGDALFGFELGVGLRLGAP
jgi:hypothetical protein